MKTTKFVVVTTATLLLGFLGKAQQATNDGGVANGLPPTAPVNGLSQFEVQGRLLTQNSIVNPNPIGTQITGSFAANARWNSMGNLNAGSQTLNGFRTQTNGRALTFGHTINNNTGELSNSLIQWGGNNSISVEPGNLEFRSFTNPGVPGFPATDNLRFSIRGNDGTGLLGSISKFTSNSLPSLAYNISDFTYVNPMLEINTEETNTGSTLGGREGIVSFTRNSRAAVHYTKYSNMYGNGIATSSYSESDFTFEGGPETYGNLSIAKGGDYAYGVMGIAFAANNNFAGTFYGDVICFGNYIRSDLKLKRLVKEETSMVSKLMKLKPMNYYYNTENQKKLGLPNGLHHGFIAQDLESIFPELIKETKVASVAYEKGGIEKFKTVNYIELIPILTKAIQELNSKVDSLSNLLNGKQAQTFVVKENNTAISEQILNETAYSLSQNVPNPFTSNTLIKYTVPTTATNASIAILNLNGTMLQQFNGLKGSGNITINGSTLQAGIYLYSLISNGQEIITKRMVLTK